MTFSPGRQSRNLEIPHPPKDFSLTIAGQSGRYLTPMRGPIRAAKSRKNNRRK